MYNSFDPHLKITSVVWKTFNPEDVKSILLEQKDINLYEKSEFIDLCFDDDDDDYDFNNINEDEEEDKCIRVKISLK